MPAAPLLILVHGTGAGRSNPADRRWWESESQTAQDLARASPDGPAELAPFRWTGRNSEKDRRAAGRALLENLREYERAGRDYRVIGHSHGGSVIWHALTASVSGAPLAHLKCWITVGTPFLQFRMAWAYAWIVLAAVAAVWTTWTVTSLLLAAWPDRALIMRHTDTSVIFGHVVTAILVLACAFLLLTPIALCAAIVLRSFPALRNVSRRVQLAAKAAAVSISIGGGAGFVVWSQVVQDNAPKAGLWAIAALLAMLWLITALLIAGTFQLIGRGLDQWHRNRREREAVALYGPLWRPFTHAFDETVAGLAASRVSPYPVTAPRASPDAAVFRQLLAGVLAPFAAVIDDFVWWMLMRRLQGADIWGLMLSQASAAPKLLSLSFGSSALADSAAQALLESAARGLGELGSDLREKLVRAGQVPDAASAVEIVGSAIKWTEVVHTLYFRDLRMMGLLEAALAEKPRTQLPKPAPPSPAGRAYRFVPLTIAICCIAFAIIGGIGRTVQSLHVAYVEPYLTATQLRIAARPGQFYGAPISVDKNPILGEYLVRLLALGSLRRPNDPLQKTLEHQTRAAAAQRLAFAYGFAGSTRMVQLYTPKDTATNTAFGKRLLPAISIHTLAGFAAARKSPPDDLVQGAIAALRNHKAGEGERELYCTAIPALFAAGRVAEANEFFIVLKTLQEPGCDEAFDRTERGAKPPLPCIEEERIARALIQLGKFDNALEIVRTCDDSDRLRTILLRAAIGTDDRTAGTRLLDAATPKGDVPADETLLRAAVLAKLGRLEEAYDLAKPFLDDPQRWLDMRRENIFRPLFDEFIKADKPERLLDHVIRGQKLVIKANDDLRVSTYQTLELARMLSEANRPDELFAIGDALISSVTDEANRALVQASPRPLIDAAEVAILIGQRDKAAEMLSSAATYVTMMATDGASRTGQLIRMLAISYSVSPDAIKNSVAELVAAIPYEPDAEERARLYSIVSGAHLKNGDPVFAIHFAQEAGLPHRVLEAYCRVLDQAIKTSAVRPPADYGLGYAYWPSPSFIGAEKSIVFRDSFGPLTCDAPRPVDRRN